MKGNRFKAMLQVWKIALRETFSNAPRFLLAILFTWLVAGVAAGEVPDLPLFAQTALLITCLQFYSHAAARIAGFNEEWASWYTPPRPGIEIEPLFIALGMLILSVAGLAIGNLLGGETGAILGLVATGLFLFWLLMRIWPVFSVPYFFKGKLRWSPSARGLLWHGPCLDRAWKITRLPLARGFVTWAFLLPMFGLLVPLLLLRIFWGSSLFINLLFYGFSLPYLSVLNLRLTALLLVEDENQKRDKR
jgi:hypothetical protein